VSSSGRLSQLIEVLEKLAQAITLQAESIDRLAASNEGLADLAMSAEDEEGHGFHLDGSPIKQ
jgi:hypothetical protein